MLAEASRRPAAICLEGLVKSYDGQHKAVDAIDLNIAAGEFFSLLGPSGCGKTTTLRLVAGFESPDAGRIVVGGDDITHVPVHQRDMGMVFQSYALFPHRSVAENVGFGLRMRKVDRAQTAMQVADALKMMALEGFADRRPSQLSGGQQQRVALARAIVIQPRVLLCDEPLGALDRKLRQNMQFELKQLQKKLGVTLIFVTHDQEEAMAMSDRIAVMNGGRIEQVGTPAEIYEQPRTPFVAAFIGESNIFSGSWDSGRFTLASGVAVPVKSDRRLQGNGQIAVRPERMRLVGRHDGALQGHIESANFLGAQVLYKVSLGNGMAVLVKEATGSAARGLNDEVGLVWSESDAVVLAS